MRQEIRVLHIVDSLFPGGTEAVAVRTVNALTDNGIRAYLCVTRNDGPLRDKLKKQIEVIKAKS